MKNVKSKKCPCGKQTNFGFPGEKAVCCMVCKEDGMVNVVSKKCQCGKQPKFGLPGKQPTHCKDCKEDIMIDVRKNKCPCGKQSFFGFPGRKAVCCMGCKEDGMVNIWSKRCPCGKRPSFGFPGGEISHCTKCKEDGMEDIVHIKCACGKNPNFGFPGGKATCCMDCKEDGMDNIISRRCQGYNGTECPTDYILTYGREYCLACDPDDSRRLDRKRDEAAFFNFLDKHITITQREFPVHYSCINTDNKYARLDGVIITKDIVVCIELDEDAHETYKPVCEKARMYNVSAELKIAYPGYSVAWVRVNPHTKKDGKRDTSTRATKIRKQRYQEALEIIKDILQNPRDCVEFVGYTLIM
jgi:hypothetical protein